jgi:GNAT superfamily N-acetyltransferase
VRVLIAVETRQLTLRVAIPADAQTLVPLCAAHAAYERLPAPPPDHAVRLQTALAQGRLHAWLLEQGDTAVGYASATVDYATLSGQLFAHLDCLYLQPEVRGQGGGQLLMHAAKEFAMSHGCLQLQWQTPEWNHSAMRFYDRLGARRVVKQRYVLEVGTKPLPAQNAPAAQWLLRH